MQALPGAGQKDPEQVQRRKRAGDAARKPGWSANLTRAVVGVTLVLMVGYTAYAILQIEQMSKPVDTGCVEARADLLAAHVSGQADTVRAALTAASNAAAR